MVQIEHNPEAKQFTIDIIKDMKARVEEWSDQYDYHFSIYSTRQKAWQPLLSLGYEGSWEGPRYADRHANTPAGSTTMFVEPHPVSFEKIYPKAGRLVTSTIGRLWATL